MLFRSGLPIAVSICALLLFGARVQARAPGSQASTIAGDPSSLLGTWTLNRELTAPTPSPDVFGRRGGSRGRGFGGGGGRGGSAQSGPEDRAAAREEGERLASLMQELMTPSTKLTIAHERTQALAFTNADGRTSRYTPDNKTEKHQMVSGVIETKSKWIKSELRQEINASDIITIIRTFAVDPATNQLVVTTTFAGNRRDEERPFRVVYDREEN